MTVKTAQIQSTESIRDTTQPRRVRTAWAGAAGALTDLVFPPHCANCGADCQLRAAGCSICDVCRQALLPGPQRCCPRCGLGIPEGAHVVDSADGCTRCCGQDWKFERVVALGEYRDALRLSVLRTKTDRQGVLTRSLAALLWEAAGPRLAAWKPDCVIPIPMHWARRWWRGVNSPERIAEVLSHCLGVPQVDALVRRRLTPQQASLRQRERQRNMVGALALRRGAPVAGQRVLLVDDVLTTGATCRAAAGVLRRGRAAAVAVAVVARAHPDVI